MAKPRPLPPRQLRAFMDPADIVHADSTAFMQQAEDIAPHIAAKRQPRALQALEMGMRIKDRGYNIYLSGEANLGRTYLLHEYLTPWARAGESPPDLMYVYNFKDQDKPRLVRLPAGLARKFKEDLAAALSKVRKEVPNRYEADAYVKRRNALLDDYQSTREKFVSEMENEASEQGFNLDMDDQGALTLYPLIEGKLLNTDEFERLDPAIRQKVKNNSDRLMSEMSQILRKIGDEERGLRENEQDLDKELVQEVLKEHLKPLMRRYNRKAKEPTLKRYLQDVYDDLLDNVAQLLPQEQAQSSPLDILGQGGGDDFFDRYDVNMFVDNSETKGAPVIVEDHPTAHNLLGCIERESEMGALVTDFTLIKAGSLHRANHGVLVLHTEDLMQNSSAWEGLLRALRSGQARIEDTGDGQEQAKTKTIEPEPIPLDVKVILIGTDYTYEMLLELDDRFPKFFKIKAHLQESVERTTESVQDYCLQLARIVTEADLPPFDRTALAGLVDYGSRLAEDQQKLSVMFPLLRELMIEAASLARAENGARVDAGILNRARNARDYRSNLYEEEFMEQYDRELIRVATSGQAMGRVNGLSVSFYGNYEIGLPHSIACTVGVGDGGILDLEREAQLGGPIHTKAMMILKTYLVGQFAQNKPIMLTGSLCFEQSYAHVEGDSASGAELAALLSALAQVPVRQCLAFTGAVNQSGQIMAVGGVTRKIEGFFEVCRRKGLTGEHGVLLPWDNRDHLMLKDEVVKAVEQDLFHIYPVQSIEEAMELLTGMQAGTRGEQGHFPENTLFHMVDVRLRQLAEYARQYAPAWGYKNAKRDPGGACGF